MAWLKIETHTPDKPEIFDIASQLGIDSDAVFGKCFRVWVWFDAHTTNGKANGVPVSGLLVDRIAGVTGFAEAMRSAGWLLFDGEGYAVPNFDRHNGETAKQRALTAKRVAKHLRKDNDKTNAAGVMSALPREEKRREDIETTSEPHKRGSRLPEDWQLPEDWKTWALTEQPSWNDEHVRKVALAFRNYWTAKSGKDAAKLNWFSTWQNWVMKEPAAKSAKPVEWWASDSATEAKGRELGLSPRAGEGWPQFKDRIRAKLSERAHA